MRQNLLEIRDQWGWQWAKRSPWFSKRVRNLKSVCVILGPYRNLTTLTASLLFLHPAIQVLNHAEKRVVKNSELNFFKSFSPSKLNKFSLFACHASGGGREGGYGGAIFYSHGFRDERMKKLYVDRYGLKPMVKQDIQSIVWKADLAASYELRRHDFDFEKIFEENQSLRFLHPMRHPLDCAKSNLETKKWRRFNNLSGAPSLEDVLEEVFKEYVWFSKIAKQHPDRMLCFTEKEYGDRVACEKLCAFLNVSSNKQWLEDVCEVVKIREKEKTDEEKILFNRLYQRYAEELPYFDFYEVGLTT